MNQLPHQQVQLTTLNGAEILSLGQWGACEALREAFSAAEGWTNSGEGGHGRNGGRCAVIFLDEADALLARCEALPSRGVVSSDLLLRAAVIFAVVMQDEAQGSDVDGAGYGLGWYHRRWYYCIGVLWGSFASLCRFFHSVVC